VDGLRTSHLDDYDNAYGLTESRAQQTTKLAVAVEQQNIP